MPFPNLDGRPVEYTEEAITKLPLYLEECLVKQSLPKRAGFALYLGISKSTLWEWEQKFEQLSNALKILDTVQEESIIDGALYNKMNAVIAKLLLSNHGYSDKIQTDNLNKNIDVPVDESRPPEQQLQEVLQRIKELQS